MLPCHNGICDICMRVTIRQLLVRGREKNYPRQEKRVLKTRDDIFQIVKEPRTDVF